MSATVYGTIQWCELSPDEITELVNKLAGNIHIYKCEDFYREVEKLGKWRDATEEDDSINIWNGDSNDTGPLDLGDGNDNVWLLVHYDEDSQKFDFACTYERVRDIDDSFLEI